MLLSDGDLRKEIGRRAAGAGPLGPGDAAAVQHRRPARPLLPGLPEPPLHPHRPGPAAGRADLARRARRRRAVRAAPGRVRARLDLRVGALPDDLAGRLEGKSSLGRLGLLTHSTAGFIDPGFTGHITLELSNVANLPITLWPGHEDRAAVPVPALQPGRAPLRQRASAPATRGSGGRPRRGRTSTSTGPTPGAEPQPGWDQGAMVANRSPRAAKGRAQAMTCYSRGELRALVRSGSPARSVHGHLPPEAC